MIVERDVSLAPLTTLGIGGPAKRLVRVTNGDRLEEALAVDDRVLVLGGGSNLVVSDAGWDGVVVQIAYRGIERVRAADDSLIHVAAGEPWDDFVAHVVADGRAGIECLSGIPGLVGATPMQNVGAYGQEVADTIAHVVAYDRELRRTVTFTPEQCHFGYRTSMFRGSTRWIITQVAFRLPRAAESMPVRYAELARALGIREGERAPLRTVRDTVIALRRGKGMVLDPGDPDSRSAGSFFTNPIVDDALAAHLPGDAPRWPQPDGRTKLSAAWLIERAGFAKGTASGRVGISSKHALALVNRGGASASELLALANEIRDCVLARFGVALALEPVVV